MSDPVLKPDWRAGGRVHNWRNHVPHYVREAWEMFSEEQRLLLYRWASDDADAEEWD